MARRSDGQLTPQQARFVEIYLSNGRKGSDAYRQAYESAASPQVCATRAYKLLHTQNIAVIIARSEKRQEQAVERAIENYAVSRERNVATLARLAYSNIKDFTRLVGSERVVDFSQATDDQLAAVQEITVEEFVDGRGEDARQVRRTRFKLSDRGVAIERLNKMFGWIIDRSEVGRPGEFANLTDEQLDEKIIEYLVELGMREQQARALLAARDAKESGLKH
jgi:phage terminase small subunit